MGKSFERKPRPAARGRGKPAVRQAVRQTEGEQTDGSGERLQKVLAAAGVGSRRECEALILEGRIAVDGEVVSKLGTKVDPALQEIRVDGEPLPRTKHVYFMVHKPPGVLSTARDPAGRPRVIDMLPPSVGRLFTVGRLDMESEGLILLTNDGELANHLTHPRYGVEKTYQVQVAGQLEPDVLNQLRRGVHLAEGVARVVGAHIKGHHKNSTIVEMVLNEGRNREIRRLLARVGHKVQRLIRTAVGPVKLGDLPSGAYRALDREEVQALRRESRRPEGAAAASRAPSEAPIEFADLPPRDTAPRDSAPRNATPRDTAPRTQPSRRQVPRTPAGKPRREAGKGTPSRATEGRTSEGRTTGSRAAAGRPKGKYSPKGGTDGTGVGSARPTVRPTGRPGRSKPGGKPRPGFGQDAGELTLKVRAEGERTVIGGAESEAPQRPAAAASPPADRPGKKFTSKKFGEKKFGEKKFGEKKFAGKKFGGKKFGGKKSAGKRFASQVSGGEGESQPASGEGRPAKRKFRPAKSRPAEGQARQGQSSQGHASHGKSQGRTGSTQGRSGSGRPAKGKGRPGSGKGTRQGR